jgi:formylglycine-generating enzyme required for sulfatase activity
VGGDPRALGGTQPVAVEVFTPGFGCARAPVSVRAYGVFLQQLRMQGVDVSEALPYPTRRGPEVSPLRFGPDDALTLAPDWDGHHWSLDWPICVIGLEQAEAYAAWIGAQRGGIARLPTEHEWERMVRGADRRLYPWGDHCEVGWAWTQEVWAPSRLACPAPVGAHPVDVSVFGVLDAVGNVASFTLDPRDADPDAPVRVRGGSWLSGLTQLRIGSRLTVPRRARPASVGLRWVRTLPLPAPDPGGALGPAEELGAAP